MRGSIRPRGKNKWQIQVYMGIGPDGKYRRHFETINGCKGDAQRKLTEIKAAYELIVAQRKRPPRPQIAM